jgi:hypothetical protein
MLVSSRELQQVGFGFSSLLSSASPLAKDVGSAIMDFHLLDFAYAFL